MTAKGHSYNFSGRQIYSSKRIWRYEPGKLLAHVRLLRRLQNAERVNTGLRHNIEHPEMFGPNPPEPPGWDDAPQTKQRPVRDFTGRLLRIHHVRRLEADNETLINRITATGD